MVMAAIDITPIQSSSLISRHRFRYQFCVDLIPRYFHDLEEWLIGTLARFPVRGERRRPPPEYRLCHARAPLRDDAR
jgi:hypothetical protein